MAEEKKQEALQVNSSVNFEITKDERLYRFCMPVGAPLGEAFDVCFMVLQHVKELAAKAVESVEKDTESKDEEKKEG